MPGQPIAMFMAVESVRRGLHEPPREPLPRRPRRPRRAIARVLAGAAVRLDPGVVARARRTAAG
jgi:hypothetical protein